MMQEYILLVEDNPDDIFFLRRAIEKIDETLAIVVVTTGDEALRFISGGAHAAHQRPLLILLDLNLPRLNGLVVLQLLKTQGWLTTIPVVIVSTSLEELHELESMSLGAKEFVKKPLTSSKVVELVRKYVPARKLNDSEQAGTAVAGAAETAFAPSMKPAAGEAAPAADALPKLDTDLD